MQRFVVAAGKTSFSSRCSKTQLWDRKELGADDNDTDWQFLWNSVPAHMTLKQYWWWCEDQRFGRFKSQLVVGATWEICAKLMNITTALCWCSDTVIHFQIPRLSVNYHLRQEAFCNTWHLSVCLSVLSVCPLATSRKNYQSDLSKNFTKEVSLDKE